MQDGVKRKSEEDSAQIVPGAEVWILEPSPWTGCRVAIGHSWKRFASSSVFVGWRTTNWCSLFFLVPS